MLEKHLMVSKHDQHSFELYLEEKAEGRMFNAKESELQKY